jgi:Family of unknown function (DUF6292)
VDPNIIPTPHPDPWVDLMRGYVTEAVSALTGQGIRIHRSWLDPRDPRDATIVYAHAAVPGEWALVWDEETGWRRGRFVDGAPGRRTVLRDLVGIGGGLVPAAGELAYRVAGEYRAQPRTYRSFGDVRDGLDDVLRGR